jgi:replication factor C subunit 3/5
LEAYKNEPFIPEYDVSIKGIVSEIFKEQSAATVKRLREAFLKLLINGIPPEFIFMGLLKEIMKKPKSEKFQMNVINECSFYENRSQNGQKAIMHLEAFIAKIMCLLVDKNNN